MLFRTLDDKLIEIRKHDFLTDSDYYVAIMKLKRSLYKRYEGLDMFNTQGVIKS